MSNISFGSLHLIRHSTSLSSDVSLAVRPENIFNSLKSDRMKPEDVYLMDVTGKEPKVKLIGKSKLAEKLTKAKNNGYLDDVAKYRGAIEIFGRHSDLDTSCADPEKSIKDGLHSVSALDYFEDTRKFYLSSMQHKVAQILSDEFEDANFPEEKKSDNESASNSSDNIDRTGYESGYPTSSMPENNEVKSSNPFKAPDLSSLNADDPDFDLNAGNSYYKTPLFKTAEFNDPDRTQKIIEKAKEEGWSGDKVKEYVNKQNADGNTALSLVRLPKDNNPEAVAKALKLAGILLDAGADCDMPNNRGLSPLDKAIKNREDVLAKFMVDYKKK